jgi:DNA (cytosine-5)-methyltransferase 1
MQLSLPFLNASAGARRSNWPTYGYYEFFAGGGMARAGLGIGWACLFANDIEPKKASAYRENWGGDHLHVADVKTVEASQLPGEADLAWASFPCQDLSLAGAGAGLKGERSGTFWPFWGLMDALAAEGRAPRLIVLENVCGTLNSHAGKDFAAIGSAIAGAGYRFGALVIDAVHFVPQSRPRLFIVAASAGLELSPVLIADGPDETWHPAHLVGAYKRLSAAARGHWVWWRLPEPPVRSVAFADLIEDEPTGVEWHTPAETSYILSLMSDVNLRKVEMARQAGRRMVGTIYRRTRLDQNGTKRQRAEIR